MSRRCVSDSLQYMHGALYIVFIQIPRISGNFANSAQWRSQDFANGGAAAMLVVFARAKIFDHAHFVPRSLLLLVL